VDYDYLCMAMDWTLFDVREVVCGGARGVDSLGARWAGEQGIPCVKFPAQWDRFGKAAGMYRNSDMADYADGLIALWDGESRGTLDMIDRMKGRREIWVDGELLEG
jgi:hypothetical protein